MRVGIIDRECDRDAAQKWRGSTLRFEISRDVENETIYSARQALTCDVTHAPVVIRLDLRYFPIITQQRDRYTGRGRATFGIQDVTRQSRHARTSSPVPG